MSDPKTVLTEAFKDSEVDCTWTPEGHANHALAALKAARIAVVELPAEDELEELTEEIEILVGSHAFGLPVSMWGKYGRDHMSIRETRRRAAALLAAADAAEASR